MALLIAEWWERSEQQQTTIKLRAEISRRKEIPPALQQVLAENRRLARLQISPVESKQLEDDQAATVRLRAEVMDIQRAMSARRKFRKPSPLVSPWMRTNAGTLLPSTTVETVLWAAAARDIETLEGLLEFTPEARTRAEVLFTELPEAIRAGFRSPERFVATSLAEDIPRVPVGFSGFTGGVDKMTVSCIFTDFSDPRPYHMVSLSMVPAGKPGGCRCLLKRWRNTPPPSGGPDLFPRRNNPWWLGDP